MAYHSLTLFLNQVNETLDQTSTNNGTEKVKSTPEGMMVAYTSLILMALLPIFIGAYRSVDYHKEQKVC